MCFYSCAQGNARPLCTKIVVVNSYFRGNCAISEAHHFQLYFMNISVLQADHMIHIDWSVIISYKNAFGGCCPRCSGVKHYEKTQIIVFDNPPESGVSSGANGPALQALTGPDVAAGHDYSQVLNKREKWQKDPAKLWIFFFGGILALVHVFLVRLFLGYLLICGTLFTLM